MLQWYKVDITIDSGGQKPPFFVGSMFRGVMGVALKRVTCINPAYVCENCFAAQTCLYHQFYEEKNRSHAFRLGITLQPKDYNFSLYLFKEAVASLPYMLSAIKKAVEEVGLGKEKRVMKLKQVKVFDKVVYDGDTFVSFDGLAPKSFQIDSYCPNVTIEFTMPLRIKENNQIARRGVELKTLISSIFQRYHLLSGEKGARLNYQVEGHIVSSSWKFVEMLRYSNRQQKGMSMGGLKGTLKIEGLDPVSYRYLKIGELIGAGKQTAFGLGSYIMKEVG